MNTKDAYKAHMDMGLFVLNTYVSDLSDADLLTRPAGCNHLAWQLGHLITSEVGIMNMISPGKGGELPAGFAERHSKETTGVDDPAQFNTKQEYVELFAKVREASLKALADLPDARLDEPNTGRMAKNFPTVGSMLTLLGSHPMMHAGQFAVARRMLGKPVLI